MMQLVALVVSLAVFLGWMSIVGNPHVVETVIGLVIAVAVYFILLRQAKKFGAKLSRN